MSPEQETLQNFAQEAFEKSMKTAIGRATLAGFLATYLKDFIATDKRLGPSGKFAFTCAMELLHFYSEVPIESEHALSSLAESVGREDDRG